MAAKRPHRLVTPRWLLGIWGLGALACAEPHPKAPEPVLIEVQGDDSEDAEPATPAAGDAALARVEFHAAAPIALRRFLEDLMSALVRRDFRRFLERCDRQNLAGQRALGVSDEQYIAEALVPSWSRARIDKQPAEDDAARFEVSDLRRIRGVQIEQVENRDSHRERYQISGMLELSGSVFFVFQLDVRRDGERYWVDPPVG
ncbi:MAG: hypothetical protein R3B07_16090 [Polyangiaceae bacterium]